MRLQSKIFVMVLMMHSFACKADWIFLEGTDTVEIYVDLSTVVGQSREPRLEYLLNFNTPQTTKGARSAIDTSEYDCWNQRRRTLAMKNFSEPMAQGRVLFSSNKPTKWRPVSSDGMEYTHWKFACNKS
jgi:hypothetical protein